MGIFCCNKRKSQIYSPLTKKKEDHQKESNNMRIVLVGLNLIVLLFIIIIKYNL
jgi:hypothetical protein